MDKDRSKKMIQKLKKLGIIQNVSDLRETNMRLQTLMDDSILKEMQPEVPEKDIGEVADL